MKNSFRRTVEVMKAKRRLRWIDKHVKKKVNAVKPEYEEVQLLLEIYMWRWEIQRLMDIISPQWKQDTSYRSHSEKQEEFIKIMGA